MHFYFDFIHAMPYEFQPNWTELSSEEIGHEYVRSRIDAVIENDQEAGLTITEVVGLTKFPPLNMAQIKEACSVNDVDDMRVIPPIHREKIFQVAIHGDWQFE